MLHQSLPTVTTAKKKPTVVYMQRCLPSKNIIYLNITTLVLNLCTDARVNVSRWCHKSICSTGKSGQHAELAAVAIKIE